MEGFEVSERKDLLNLAQKKPLKLAYYIIRYPRRIIFIMICLLLIVTFIDFLGFEFVPENAGYNYYVNNDIEVQKMLSLDVAIEMLSESDSTKFNPKEQIINDWTIIPMFETLKYNNILNIDNIKYIIETNRLIFESNPSKYYNLCYSNSLIDTDYPDCSDSAKFDPIMSYFLSYVDDGLNITQDTINEFIQYYMDFPDQTVR